MASACALKFADAAESLHQTARPMPKISYCDQNAVYALIHAHINNAQRIHQIKQCRYST